MTMGGMDTTQLEWTFADRLRKVRKESRLNQGEFAALIHEAAGSVANWEAGASKPRHLVDVCQKIEEELKFPGLAAWLLGLSPGEARTAGWLYVPTAGQYSLFDEPRTLIDLTGPPTVRIPTAA